MTDERTAVLQRTGALWATPLLRIGALQRTAALKRPASVLPLTILILARDTLRKRRRSAHQRHCCGQTLRRKCNFIHRAHLVRPGISRAPSHLQVDRLPWLLPEASVPRTPNMHSTYRNFSKIPSCQALTNVSGPVPEAPCLDGFPGLPVTHWPAI